jgi:hypothetical protein
LFIDYQENLHKQLLLLASGMVALFEPEMAFCVARRVPPARQDAQKIQFRSFGIVWDVILLI